jgi:flagellar motor switch protein FliN/FliY
MTDQQPDRASVDNVYADVTVELGRREITLGEARRLKEGDFVDFDKLAGEAFDILINQRLFAEGEIVVVTDLMAIRITRLIDRRSKVST